MMKANGPLPLAWRNYIAVMAASRHRCEYIVRRQQVEFLYNGGDSKWLQGLEFAPQKLQNLAQFNALLAHQPWALRESHVEHLAQGSDPWSIGELVHAVTLMCHFHSMCGIIHGCGLTLDDEYAPLSDVAKEEDSYEDGENTNVLEQLHVLETQEDDDDDTDAQKKTMVFEKAGEMTFTETTPSPQQPVLSYITSKMDLTKFLGVDHNMAYKDFDVKSKDYKVFIVQVRVVNCRLQNFARSTIGKIKALAC